MTLDQLNQSLEKFSAERDWDQFHSPKNLAMALSVEVAELLEPFMWLTPEQSKKLTDATQEQVTDEIGDVMICLLNLARKLNINPLAAAEQKLQKNALKYPVDKAKGLAVKYNELK